MITKSSQEGHRTVANLRRQSITGIVGTAHFIAPEVLGEGHYYSFAVDWWACGVLFYECTVRRHLFDGHGKLAVFKMILNDKINLSELVKKSSELGDLTGKLLVREPKNRLGSNGASGIKEHPFFRSEEWNRISEIDPSIKPDLDKNTFMRMSPEWTRVHFFGETPSEVIDFQARVKNWSQSQRARKVFQSVKISRAINRSARNLRRAEIYSLREVDNEDEDGSDSVSYEGVKVHPF